MDIHAWRRWNISAMYTNVWEKRIWCWQCFTIGPNVVNTYHVPTKRKWALERNQDPKKWRINLFMCRWWKERINRCLWWKVRHMTWEYKIGSRESITFGVRWTVKAYEYSPQDERVIQLCLVKEVWSVVSTTFTEALLAYLYVWRFVTHGHQIEPTHDKAKQLGL